MGLRSNQLTKKKDAVKSCTISTADKYPSARQAILLSVIPNNQDEVPSSQIPFFKLSKNTVASDDC